MKGISESIAVTALICAVTAALTWGVVTSMKAFDAQATEMQVTLNCISPDEMLEVLTVEQMKLVFTGTDIESNTDEFTQTWTSPSGKWMVIEFVPAVQLMCILANGSTSKLTKEHQEKSNWS